MAPYGGASPNTRPLPRLLHEDGNLLQVCKRITVRPERLDPLPDSRMCRFRRHFEMLGEARTNDVADEPGWIVLQGGIGCLRYGLRDSRVDAPRHDSWHWIWQRHGSVLARDIERYQVLEIGTG